MAITTDILLCGLIILILPGGLTAITNLFGTIRICPMDTIVILTTLTTAVHLTTFTTGITMVTIMDITTGIITIIIPTMTTAVHEKITMRVLNSPEAL